MSDTPRTDAAHDPTAPEKLYWESRKLERELAEAKDWIACVAPRYEALALPHLEKPVEQWPDAVVGCRAILETCPLDQWDTDRLDWLEEDEA